MINKKKMDESDNLYLEKARLLDELQLIEAENNKCLQEIDQRLLDLDPDQRNEYEQIKEDNQTFIMRIYQLREEMAHLNADLIEGENFLKDNPNKKEAHLSIAPFSIVTPDNIKASSPIHTSSSIIIAPFEKASGSFEPIILFL